MKRNKLTRREMQVVKCISDGMTNKEIGAKLHISHKTVDTHRTNVMRKTKSRNAAMLVRYAFENEILEKN